MAKKDKLATTWHGKAIRLMEGGIETIDGHPVRMVKYTQDIHPCDICKMDSICTAKEWGVQEMCCYIESLTKRRFYLDLVARQ